MNPTFQFPFPPYPIQEHFMKELYFTIENGELGIFESPTGTGKSLSICCGALQWLKDNSNRQLEKLKNEIAVLKLETKETSTNASNEDWIQEQSENITKVRRLRSLVLQLEHIEKRKESFERMKLRVAESKKSGCRKTKYSHGTYKTEEEGPEDGDEDLLLEEVAEAEAEGEGEEAEGDEEGEEADEARVVVSSRTHGQLAQFAREVRRSPYGAARVVTLASRRHCCVLPAVARLRSAALANERCLELQKPRAESTRSGDDGTVVKKTKACSGCPYYNQRTITELKERLLVEPMDMEDLVKTGKELKACPYYASRMALTDAELVLVPHATVCSAGARAGLPLRGAALVLDEAHALPAALRAAAAAPLPRRAAARLPPALAAYAAFYRARLPPAALLRLEQLRYVLRRLLRAMERAPADGAAAVLSVPELAAAADIDHINLLPLVAFCRAARLAPKLHSFSLRRVAPSAPPASPSAPLLAFLAGVGNKPPPSDPAPAPAPACAPPDDDDDDVGVGGALYAALELLQALGAPAEGGRAVLSRERLSFLLLEPRRALAAVRAQTRSLVLAGGTMEPLEEFRALLGGLGGEPARPLRVVRCEHVAPASQLLALCVSRGPGGGELEFSHAARREGREAAALREAAAAVRAVCEAAPGGVVCFAPSYEFAERLHEALRRDGHLAAVRRRKPVFREPRDGAQLERVLGAYCAAASAAGGGALLLGVVGGKLSEGLSFGDALARVVLLVGLPHAHAADAELRAVMRHLGAEAGRRHYRALCARAVAQTLGRALRHARDYAALLLLDRRYSCARTAPALPAFVRRALRRDCAFADALAAMSAFFARHERRPDR